MYSCLSGQSTRSEKGLLTLVQMKGVLQLFCLAPAFERFVKKIAVMFLIFMSVP